MSSNCQRWMPPLLPPQRIRRRRKESAGAYSSHFLNEIRYNPSSLNTQWQSQHTHSNINHYIQTPRQTFLHFQIWEMFWSFGLHGSLCCIIHCKTFAKWPDKKALQHKTTPHSSKASNSSDANIFFQSSFAVLWLVWCVCYWFFRHYVWELNIWF